MWAAGPGDAWAVGDARHCGACEKMAVPRRCLAARPKTCCRYGACRPPAFGRLVQRAQSCATKARRLLGDCASHHARHQQRLGNLASNVWMVAGPDVFVWNGNNYQKYTPSLSDMTAVGGFSTRSLRDRQQRPALSLRWTRFTPVETGTRNNPLWDCAFGDEHVAGGRQRERC